MKRFLVIILTIFLFSSMVVTVHAITPTLSIPNITIPEIKVNFIIPDNFFDRYFETHEVELLEAPMIHIAKYVHKTTYSGINKHLEIRWNKVDGAESYEVLITKEDGTEITYNVSSNIVYDTKVDCPKVYVENTSSWSAASVKVRAVCGDIASEWSELVKISCDMAH